MIEFIIEYWLEVAFGVFSTAMIVWIEHLRKKLKQQDALKEGMKAILHDMLFQLCEKYLALSYIPVEESEEVLARAETLWNAYSGLDGNGTGEKVYTRFTNLPIKNA